MALSRVIAALAKGRVPNSWFFVGAEPESLLRAAIHVAQALVCENGTVSGDDVAPSSGCGECGPCRRVVVGSSESVMWLRPEKNLIKIEAAREVLQQLSLANTGRARLVIVEGANFLNPQTANALLKAIEEPPPRTHFILLAGSQESIMTTLRSRSQLVYFPAENKAREALEPEFAGLAESSWRQLFDETPDSALVAYLRDGVEGREAALMLVREWHRALRDGWVAHGALPYYARVSELFLQAERDLMGNCEAQLTLENLVYQVHRAQAGLPAGAELA